MFPMEPMDPKPAPYNKPLAGMIVVLSVALFVGGWLYVDYVKNDLEAQINTVAAEAAAAQVQARNAAMKTSNEAAPTAGKRTYAWQIGSLEDATFEYPSDWVVDREGDGVAGFYGQDGGEIAKIECSRSVEDIGGITAGATVNALDFPMGAETFHYVVKKYPTSNWLAFIENKQPFGSSCLLSFIQSRLDETTYHGVVDSFTVVKK